MKFRILIALLLAFSFFSLNAQENTAILCADGMDNDGDGLTDCQDPDCQTFPAEGCNRCFEDGLSFADYIIDYSPECPDNLVDPYMTPTDALGVPDNDPSIGGLGLGRVTLGEGGSITVGFSNNLVTNTGNSDPDVWVFEVGSDVEGTTLDFRPFDAATISTLNANGILDVDGDGYYEFGAIGGATSSIDLDAIVPGLVFGEIKFDAIKLTDILDNPCNMPTSGADIDAICALSSLPQEVCGNGIDDDGDGLIDCDDDDLIDTCCCLDPDEIDLGPDLEVCEGGSIVLDAGPGFVSYLWQDGQTTQIITAELEQEYKVIGIDTCMNEVVDVFFLTLIQNEIVEVELSFCEGNSVTYNGEVYDDAGSYEQIITTPTGCDTTLLITVAENPNYSILFNFEICEGDSIFLNNVTYTDAGEYEQNLLTESNCDSILLINIEFEGSYSQDLSFEICQGDTISFLSIEYFESGNYEQLIESEGACDSTYFILITELPTSSSNESYTICEGESVNVNGTIYDADGAFEQTLTASNGCDSTLVINVNVESSAENQIEFNLCNGGTVEVNNVEYTQSGTYTQNLVAANGCDSTLTIDVSLSELVLNYDFEDCQSTIIDGANANYGEFEAEEITVLDCGTIAAGNVYRDDPEVNIHSCTPGVDGSIAMCVSSVDDCSLDTESTKAVVFEITLSPNAGESMGITCFDFYEKSPPMFDWFAGGTGPNNFPQFYELTILKNGVAVFTQNGNPTEQEWNQESYDFSNNIDFNVSSNTTFTFRLTPYCQTDNGSTVSAWDIDEISISAQCGVENRIISGRMMTEEGMGVQQVLLSNEAPVIDHFEEFITEENGNYTFLSNPLNQDYSLSATKNTFYMEGVSTLDLLLIQKHILGLSKFDSPYKMIAADITNDQNISALDLIHLRKLILGIDVEFANNDSWRFVTNDSPITLENPWIFNEEFFYENLSENQNNQDMTAVKIGDVNGSISNMIGGISTESRSDNTIQFELKDQFLRKGESINISLNSPSEMSLSGLQLMMETKGVELKIVESNLPNFNTAHANVENEECRIAWSDINNAKDFKQDDLIIAFEITAAQDIWLGESLQLSKQLASEIYSQNGSSVSPLELRFIKDQVGDLQLYQNHPNPFSSNTTIGFNLAEEGTVRLSIINIEGKLIYNTNQYLDQGNQEISIGSDEIGSIKGVLYYQLEFDGNQITKRMVRL